MKRFGCLMLFFCIAAVWVSAQEVKVGSGTLELSGKVASGVFFDADDAVQFSKAKVKINDAWLGPDGRVRMWNESDNDSPMRADLTATYTLDNIGFRIRLRSNEALDGFNSNIFARYAYGWINLFGDGLKFTGGWIDLSDNVWGTLGDLDKDIGGNGIRVELKPLKFFNLDEEKWGSLNLGAFFQIPAKENSNIGRDDQGRPVYRTVTLQRALQETALGFRFTHPWFYVSSQLQLDSDVDGSDLYQDAALGTSILASNKIWSSAADDVVLMFGVGFTLLPELKLSVEGIFNGMGNWEARGNADLRQTVSYSFSKLSIPVLERVTLGMKAQELLWGYNLDKHLGSPWDEVSLSPWMQLKPFVDFRIAPGFTAGLETGFGAGHLALGSLTLANSNNGSPNNKDVLFTNEKSNVFLKPNLSYHFPAGLSLKMWYKITFIKYANLSDANAFDDLAQSAVPKQDDNYHLADSLTKQQFALEFIWTF